MFNRKLIIVNFVLLLIIGYFGLSYLKNQNQKEIIFNSSKRAVLGVSKTIEDDNIDKELVKILKVTDIEAIQKQKSQVSINNSMKLLMNNSSIQSQSSYTPAIAQELDIIN